MDAISSVMAASTSSGWFFAAPQTARPFFGRTFISASHGIFFQAHAFAMTGSTVTPSRSRRFSSAGTSFLRMKSDERKFAVTSRIATLALEIAFSMAASHASPPPISSSLHISTFSSPP